MIVAGGIGTAGASVAGTWLLAGLLTRNLPVSAGAISLASLLLVAALSGFLAGSAICRRATRNRYHLGLFAGMAGAVAGGVLGCTYAITLTVAYLMSYSTWPQDRFDQVLVLLAYPVFAALGLCVGCVVGLVLGVVLGGLVRVVSLAR
jgi:hypothetical protein